MEELPTAIFTTVPITHSSRLCPSPTNPEKARPVVTPT